MCYRACSKEQFIGKIRKIKRFSLISRHPQDAWTPIWLNACLTIEPLNHKWLTNINYFESIKIIILSFN